MELLELAANRIRHAYEIWWASEERHRLSSDPVERARLEAEIKRQHECLLQEIPRYLRTCRVSGRQPPAEILQIAAMLDLRPDEMQVASPRAPQQGETDEPQRFDEHILATLDQLRHIREVLELNPHPTEAALRDLDLEERTIVAIEAYLTTSSPSQAYHTALIDIARHHAEDLLRLFRQSTTAIGTIRRETEGSSSYQLQLASARAAVRQAVECAITLDFDVDAIMQALSGRPTRTLRGQLLKRPSNGKATPVKRVRCILLEGETEELHAVLTAAFPSYDELRVMFNLKLNENLANSASPGPLPTVLVDVIAKFQAAERIHELVAAAASANPTNRSLQTFARRLGVSAGKRRGSK